MAKIERDEFLDRLTPEDIENIILPTLKADKEKKLAERAYVVEKKLSKKRLLAFLFLFVFIGLGVFSGIKVLAWKIDSDNTYAQIELINESVVIEEVEDTETTEIVNPPVEEDPANPYWDYIKITVLYHNQFPIYFQVYNKQFVPLSFFFYTLPEYLQIPLPNIILNIHLNSAFSNSPPNSLICLSMQTSASLPVIKSTYNSTLFQIAFSTFQTGLHPNTFLILEQSSFR